MWKCLLMFLLLSIGMPAFAAKLEPEERARNVISLLKENKPIEAFEKAFSGNELVKIRRPQ